MCHNAYGQQASHIPSDSGGHHLLAKTTTNAQWGHIDLGTLRKLAFKNRDMTSSFDWLKAVGLVPEDVSRMDIRQVLTDLDPDNISVAYLAAAAYEWDTWGEASPVDFVKAIAAETRGAKRDLITETLMALGRQMVAA